MCKLSIDFHKKCLESDEAVIRHLTNDFNQNSKYKLTSEIYHLNRNNTLLTDGKLLLFNQRKHGNGIVYITEQ